MRCEPLGRQEHPHAVGSEAEIGVEADGDTRKLCNPFHTDENSGHEGGAIDGVVTDRQGLPGGTEDDLLVGDCAHHAHPVHPDAGRSDPAPSTGVNLLRCRVIGPLTGGGRHPFSGVGGGTGGGVDLGVVVELDDLGRLEVRSGEFGHADHEHRTDREVRRDQGVRRRERDPKRLEILVAEPGRADNGVDAVDGSEVQGLPCGVEHGEVDDNVSSLLGQLLEGVVEVDTGHQFDAWVGIDGATNLLAHLPCGSDNSYANHVCRLGPRPPPSVARSSTFPGMFAAIGDTPHNIMHLLHVPTGFVAFARAITHPVLSTSIRNGGSTERPAVFGHIAENAVRIFGSSLIISGLLGFSVAGMNDEVHKVRQGWLIAAVIVWIGVLHALVRPGEKGVAAGGASAEHKLPVGGIVLTLLFVVQLIIMIWRPGV